MNWKNKTISIFEFTRHHSKPFNNFFRDFRFTNSREKHIYFKREKIFHRKAAPSHSNADAQHDHNADDGYYNSMMVIIILLRNPKFLA